ALVVHRGRVQGGGPGLRRTVPQGLIAHGRRDEFGAADRSIPRSTDLTDEEPSMSRARVHNFSISLDGFGTGEGLSPDAPFGHAGQRLTEWMVATRFGREVVLGGTGGSEGLDHAMAERHGPGIGAEVMGSRKSGPRGWHDDPDWRGWWGEDPPFHTPVFVLTHRPRPPLEMAGGTTFHFVDLPPTEALALAREAAD